MSDGTQQWYWCKSNNKHAANLGYYDEYTKFRIIKHTDDSCTFVMLNQLDIGEVVSETTGTLTTEEMRSLAAMLTEAADTVERKIGNNAQMELFEDDGVGVCTHMELFDNKTSPDGQREVKLVTMDTIVGQYNPKDLEED